MTLARRPETLGPTAFTGIIANLLVVGLPSSAFIGLSELLWSGSVLLVLSCLIAASEAIAVETAGVFEIMSVGSKLQRLSACSAIALLIEFWIALATPCVDMRHGAGTFTFLSLAGALFMLAGLYMRLLAIRTLGERFGIDDRTLAKFSGSGTIVDSGIYRRVRHPSETGHILLSIGAAVAVGSFVAAAWVFLIMVPLTLGRLRQEERALSMFFPAYRSYRRITPALIPAIAIQKS